MYVFLPRVNMHIRCVHASLFEGAHRSNKQRANEETLSCEFAEQTPCEMWAAIKGTNDAKGRHLSLNPRWLRTNNYDWVKFVGLRPNSPTGRDQTWECTTPVTLINVRPFVKCWFSSYSLVKKGPLCLKVWLPPPTLPRLVSPNWTIWGVF